MRSLTCQYTSAMPHASRSDSDVHSPGAPAGTALGDVNSSSAHAHERLRRAVVRLELPPGTAVSEQQLAARFGLSKAAVRAAIARLRESVARSVHVVDDPASIDRFLDANRAVHVSVARAAGNRRLAAVVERL